MNVKHKLVILAIALIFALFIGYGVEVFDPSPQRNDYCPERAYQAITEESCIEVGGEWQKYANAPKLEGVEGVCQESKECYDNYNAAQEVQGKTVFIVALVIGILTIILSFLLKKEEVSSGLLGGSILLILYGTMRYWQYAQNVLKFVLLGTALVVLIWVGYKKLK